MIFIKEEQRVFYYLLSKLDISSTPWGVRSEEWGYSDILVSRSCRRREGERGRGREGEGGREGGRGRGRVGKKERGGRRGGESLSANFSLLTDWVGETGEFSRSLVVSWVLTAEAAPGQGGPGWRQSRVLTLTGRVGGPGWAGRGGLWD